MARGARPVVGAAPAVPVLLAVIGTAIGRTVLPAEPPRAFAVLGWVSAPRRAARRQPGSGPAHAQVA